MGEHASALQDILSLSPGSWGAAHKKALLARLELQYALALLKLVKSANAPAMKAQKGALELERGTIKVSSHASEALKLFRNGEYTGCASELYAANALLSKIIPKLKKEGKK